MKLSIILLSFLFLFCGCHEHAAKVAAKVAAKTKASPVDTNLIVSPCSVMIDPTDAQLKKLKKQDGAENFYAMADDNQFYMGSAIGYLDSIHCHMVNKKAKGAASFQTRSGRVVKVNLGQYY